MEFLKKRYIIGTISQIDEENMMKDRTTTLLAAYRTLKATFYLCFLPDDLIPIDDWHSWVTIRDSAIEEICYDIYDKILAPCLEDYKRGVHFSMAEQRMLVKSITIIREEGDFFTRPWDKEFKSINDKRFQKYLQYLNDYRKTIMAFLNDLHIHNIAQFRQLVAPFLNIFAPENKFLRNKIEFYVKVPDGTGHQNKALFRTFEMTLLEEDGKLIVSPIVSGEFFYHLGPKKVNIETGEIMNKVKYDLYNYTVRTIE